jgi:hypothetical protein
MIMIAALFHICLACVEPERRNEEHEEIEIKEKTKLDV